MEIHGIALQGEVDEAQFSLVVDGDAYPRIPYGLKLEGKGIEHRTMGKVALKSNHGRLYANGREVTLYLSLQQQNGHVIKGRELHNELKGKQALNACVLDALLAHPWMIPDEWKDECVYFWGTVFSHPDGSLCVECLFWDDGGDRWRWNYSRFAPNDGDVWEMGKPAACLAN